MNIHVGNLAREVTEAELRQAFEPFGRVAAVRIVTDRHNSVSRGFGFVDMPERAEAEAAMEALNMKEFAGRTLDLSESNDLRSSKRGGKPYGGAGRNRPVSSARKRGSPGSKRQRF